MSFVEIMKEIGIKLCKLLGTAFMWSGKMIQLGGTKLSDVGTDDPPPPPTGD